MNWDMVTDLALLNERDRLKSKLQIAKEHIEIITNELIQIEKVIADRKLEVKQ